MANCRHPGHALQASRHDVVAVRQLGDVAGHTVLYALCRELIASQQRRWHGASKQWLRHGRWAGGALACWMPVPIQNANICRQTSAFALRQPCQCALPLSPAACRQRQGAKPGCRQFVLTPACLPVKLAGWSARCLPGQASSMPSVTLVAVRWRHCRWLL